MAMVSSAKMRAFLRREVWRFLKAYTWDGTELRDRFALDFTALKLGRPHVMRFGSRDLYRN
jgi:selenium-binding protein 1